MATVLEPTSDATAPLDALARLAAQPDATARGGAGALYTSPALLDLEIERIFNHDWQCVGRADEWHEPGDYSTTTIGRTPVIIVRQQDGSLAALLNICAHRMAKIVEGAGNTSRFSCPYHGWTYDADGTLLFAPYMQPDFDKASCALTRARIETWMGFVYVNLDAQAPSLESLIEPLTGLIRNYRLGDMRIMHKATEVWDGNWKIATENFLESYHLHCTHAPSIGYMAPVEAISMADEGPYHAFHRVVMAEAPPPFEGSLLIDNPDITPEEEGQVFAGGVFPNHLFTVQRDQITWMRTQPLSTDRTLIEWGIAGAFDWPGDAPDPEHPEFYYMREMPHVNAEDRAIVAAVQIGAASGLVSPARLHPVEHGLLTFARYVDRRLRRAVNSAG